MKTLTEKDHSELLIECEKIRQSATGIVAKHLNKRISLPISRWVVKHTRWTPNQITYFNMVVGLLAGLLAGYGTLLSLFLAGLTFQMVSILDGVDGEVAKLTKNCSPWGQWLDTISDNGSLALFLIGTTVGLYRMNPHGPVISLSITTFGVVAFIIGTMLIFLKKETNSGSFVTYDKEFLSNLTTQEFPIVTRMINLLKYAVKKDFYSFLFFLICLIGQPMWILYACAYGGLITALFIAYLHIMKWMDNACWAEESEKVI